MAAAEGLYVICPPPHHHHHRRRPSYSLQSPCTLSDEVAEAKLFLPSPNRKHGAAGIIINNGLELISLILSLTHSLFLPSALCVVFSDNFMALCFQCVRFNFGIDNTIAAAAAAAAKARSKKLSCV